ncbi:hypothetical protein [Micromonospora sp. U21]|uniref:hypothetical protein n=1 Tax=Micromonospora sp. U21 TaxID=2824899 RepID=UPI001B3838AD|nr:hypothetical protein [Micromonospora sp. U21]MBQ0905019.1 hypothetical protein [Micromonospora sp. U21]
MGLYDGNALGDGLELADGTALIAVGAAVVSVGALEGGAAAGSVSLEQPVSATAKTSAAATGRRRRIIRAT